LITPIKFIFGLKQVNEHIAVKIILPLKSTNVIYTISGFFLDNITMLQFLDKMVPRFIIRKLQIVQVFTLVGILADEKYIMLYKRHINCHLYWLLECFVNNKYPFWIINTTSERFLHIVLIKHGSTNYRHEFL
jgi:hypothetical protein